MAKHNDGDVPPAARTAGSVALLAIALLVGGSIWFLYRVTEKTLEAIDRGIGSAFWLALGIFVAALVLYALAGIVVAIVRKISNWSREIKPDSSTGLYPVHKRRGGYDDPNEPQVKLLAAMSSVQRPTAPVVQRILDHNGWNQVEALPNLPALPASDPDAFDVNVSLPGRVEVYSAPLSRELSLPVGMDGSGRSVALPLRNLGNVMAAGLMGMGKSELLGAMIAGLLRQDASGERVQLVIIDTKLVSFGNMPATLPALRWPVAVEVEEARDVLEALLAELRRRYQMLRDANARSLDEYVQRTGEPLPHLVAIIDEIADLTSDSDRRRAVEFNGLATEIGRKGRAAGVTLVMATQRPSVDVIPSSLRNLAGSTIALRVQRPEDSRTILGMAGAEQLPAVPGRCIVSYRGTRVVQAYASGLEGRDGQPSRFDTFLAGLPLLAAPRQTQSYNRSTGIPVQTTVYRHETDPQPGIPVFSTDNRAAYSPEQVVHIQSRYAALGSIKAVERELYDQDGGYWFYRLQQVLR